MEVRLVYACRKRRHKKVTAELLPELPQNTDNATSPPRKCSRFLKYMDDTKLGPPQSSYPLEDYLSATCLFEDADPLAYWKGQEDLNPTGLGHFPILGKKAL